MPNEGTRTVAGDCAGVNIAHAAGSSCTRVGLHRMVLPRFGATCPTKPGFTVGSTLDGSPTGLTTPVLSFSGPLKMSNAPLTIAARTGTPVISARPTAAAALEEAGTEAEVINARFAKPLDEETILAAAEKCGRAVVVEENVAPGGIGEAILHLLNDNGLGQLPITLMTLPDRFIEHGSQKSLLAQAGLTPEKIAENALALVRERRRV